MHLPKVYVRVVSLVPVWHSNTITHLITQQTQMVVRLTGSICLTQRWLNRKCWSFTVLLLHTMEAGEHALVVRSLCLCVHNCVQLFFPAVNNNSFDGKCHPRSMHLRNSVTSLVFTMVSISTYEHTSTLDLWTMISVFGGIANKHCFSGIFLDKGRCKVEQGISFLFLASLTL